MPRGCTALARTKQYTQISNERKRVLGEPIQVSFTKTLRPEQEEALKAMLSFDNGILHAPTASGKTVIAAALIAAMIRAKKDSKHTHSCASF
jgi:superfamily II DNA or RNA helicase